MPSDSRDTLTPRRAHDPDPVRSAPGGGDLCLSGVELPRKRPTALRVARGTFHAAGSSGAPRNRRNVRESLPLNELPLSVFRHAIKTRHHSNAALIRRERVREQFGANTEWVWEGEVLVFGLLDVSPLMLCYVWSEGSSVTCVLHEPPVDSPEAAVRASIALFVVPEAEDRRIESEEPRPT